MAENKYSLPAVEERGKTTVTKNIYEADCEVVHETDGAWLLSIDGDEYWVPKACLENSDDLEVGEKTVAEIHEWFAIEKEMV